MGRNAAEAEAEEEVEGVCRVTVETPSTNFVLKRTLALLNIPSLSDTTINWQKEEAYICRYGVEDDRVNRKGLPEHY